VYYESSCSASKLIIVLFQRLIQAELAQQELGGLRNKSEFVPAACVKIVTRERRERGAYGVLSFTIPRLGLKLLSGGN
jgi:hypothetical protein